MNEVNDRDILTKYDLGLVRDGLPPKHFDALVLYAEDDENFVAELVAEMEGNYQLRVSLYWAEANHVFDFAFRLQLCIKDRDLLCGSYELDTITRLISGRCQRVIVVLSPAFLKSVANEFFTNFALHLSVEQRSKIIIPCLYKPCEVPAMLRFYFALVYRRTAIYNFWEKMRDAIRN